ncbi:hypothetical protein Tco_1559803 [Tanacetum coccineum]
MSSFNQRGCYVCGGPLDGFVDGVLASGVEIILEMDFVRFALQELEIHSFMIQIRILSIILQTFSTTLHSPSSRHTRVSYVGTILIMVMIVHHEYRLSMSRNRATIKTLVIIIIHKIHRFFHNNIFVVKSVGHEKFQCQPRNQNFYEPNLCCENCGGPHENFNQPPQYSIDHQPQNIQEDLNQQRINDVLKAIQSLVEKLRQQEQTANLSTHTPEPSRRFNFIYDDDDDDEESTIPLNEVISQIPPSIAITPVLPTMEPEDSLIIGDENLSTIPEKEPDEFIKSSIEDLVPISSESEDTSDSDNECDFPFCDNFVTFSNPLFDANDDECFDPGGDNDEINIFLEIDDSFPVYETFCFNIEEKNSGSTTTHSDFFLPEYDSFIFDLSIDRFLLPIGVFFIMRSSPINSITSYLHRVWRPIQEN